jgi:glucokinase
VEDDAVVAAVDVGGTGMKGALVDTSGTVILTARRATPAHAGPDAVIEALVCFVAALVAEFDGRTVEVRAVGIAVPGIVDEPRGVAVLSANLGWRELPLRQLLASRLKLPVVLVHDVRAGGLAEVRKGAARGAPDAVFVPVGTGVAAAILAGGRLLTGAGYAGELGHVVVDPAGALCRCGSRGCLETVASASAVARRYSQRSQRSVVDAAEVARRVTIGDVDARAVWDEAVNALAGALATVTTLLAPEVIVVGGGLAESGELLLGPLRTGLNARLTFQRRPRVIRAELGDNAGCLGAALLALEAAL